MNLHKRNLRAVITGFPVSLVYLHGSCAMGKNDRESDIDIGLLADSALSKEERRNLRTGLMQPLAEALEVPLETLDVVILQDVPVLLQYNVIRNGKILFERKHEEKVAYELRVEQQYDDERYYLSRETDLLLHHILSPSA